MSTNMKKIIVVFIIMVTLSLMSNHINAQSTVTVTKQGTVFTANKTEEASSYKETKFSYVDTDGKTYTIYTHTIQSGDRKGITCCYIHKASKKTGNLYWKEIPVKPEELK